MTALTGGACVGIVFWAMWTAVFAGLLRLAARIVGNGSDVPFLRAAFAVNLAGFTQMCASVFLGGTDGGLVGTVVGFAVWSGVVAVVTDLPFTRALLVGVVFTVLHYVLLVVGVLIGIAGILGITLI